MTAVQEPLDSPEALGLDPVKVHELRQRVRREVDEGVLPAAQFALARHGRLAAYETFGDAGPRTRFTIFSCVKPFVASGLWLLMGEGKLQVERPVADYIPEFAGQGKGEVTVEQVMLHTAGFPTAPLGALDAFDRQRRIAAFGRWPLEWVPGTAFEYHPLSAYWVLAEVLERLGGQDYRDFLHERVTGPLGLPRTLGFPRSEQDDIAKVGHCGEPATPDELEAALGIRELPDDGLDDEVVVLIDDPDVLTLGVPGGGGVATAATVALFYQAVLDSRLWKPEIVADALAVVRNSFPDPLHRIPTTRTLTFEVAGGDGHSHLRGFGYDQPPRSFGHGGLGGQISWADPDSGLSFSYVTNGLDRNNLRENRRGIDLSTLAARCVV